MVSNHFKSWSWEVVAAWVGTDVATGEVPTVANVFMERFRTRDNKFNCVAMRVIVTSQQRDRIHHMDLTGQHPQISNIQAPGAKVKRVGAHAVLCGKWLCSAFVAWSNQRYRQARTATSRLAPAGRASMEVKRRTWGSTFFLNASSLLYWTKDVLMNRQWTVETSQDEDACKVWRPRYAEKSLTTEFTDEALNRCVRESLKVLMHRCLEKKPGGWIRFDFISSANFKVSYIDKGAGNEQTSK
jgi:hypothetical protein